MEGLRPIPQMQIPRPNSYALHRQWTRRFPTTEVKSLGITAEASSLSSSPPSPTAGEKMVVELVGALNELTERMNVLSSSSSRLHFKALELSIPILQSLPLSPDSHSPLTKALSVIFSSPIFRWMLK